MFRSAVLKLTAAYVAIIMSISLIFSLVLYRVAVSELQTGFQNQYLRWFDAYRTYGLRQPGAPTEELALRSHDILVNIIYINVLLLILSSIACYILAKRTLRPLEVTHEQQKRFTADVSHELRTPLTAMRMESEVALLDTKTKPDVLRSTLKSNLEEIGRMEKLINNLLSLSTIEADKLRMEFALLDVKDISDEAIHAVRKFADTRSIKIQVSLQSAHISGNKDSLRQLFIILLENAIKYSLDGSTVIVGQRKKSGSLFVDIIDSGEGISSDALPHVFDRFYRADQSRNENCNKETRGFGLGLSLAKLIADLHGIEIILSSSPGSGTTATVRLPTAPKK